MGYVLAATCLMLAAEEPVELLAFSPVPGASKTALHLQLTRLVREDAGTFVAPEENPIRNDMAPIVADAMIMLEPMTVNGKKIVIPPPRHETRVQEFFRTGTIWENVGPRFTQRLWVRGDKGIMFTILW